MWYIYILNNVGNFIKNKSQPSVLEMYHSGKNEQNISSYKKHTSNKMHTYTNTMHNIIGNPILRGSLLFIWCEKNSSNHFHVAGETLIESQQMKFH